MKDTAVLVLFFLTCHFAFCFHAIDLAWWFFFPYLPFHGRLESWSVMQRHHTLNGSLVTVHGLSSVAKMRNDMHLAVA